MTLPRLNLAVIAAVNTALPICSFTSDGRLIETNAPFAVWAAQSESALLGVRWNALFWQSRDADNPRWDEVLARGKHEIELVLAPNSAAALPCTLSRITTDQGKLLRFVLSAGRVQLSCTDDCDQGHASEPLAAGG